MGTPSVEGAAAAAEYFMALYTYARVTGDPSLLAGLSGPDCATCTAIVGQVDAAREQGNHAEGYAITVHQSNPTELVTGESFTVELHLTEGSSVVRDESGTVVSETAETDRVLRFGLRWSGNWIVEALGVEAAG